MNKVTLRELHIVGLQIEYARKMDERKIIHYVVPIISIFINKLDRNIDSLKELALEQVKAYIVKEEGETEFTVIPCVKSKDGSPVNIIDASSIVESADLKYKPAFDKLASARFCNMFSQVAIKLPFKERVKDFFIDIYNNTVLFIDNAHYFVHCKILRKDPKNYYCYNWPKPIFRQAYLCRLDWAVCLCMAFEREDAEQATIQLFDDLKSLHDMGLITGSLGPIGMITLADTVGIEHPMVCLFCMPMINTEAANVGDKDLVQALKEKGIKSVTREGDITYFKDYSKKYDIEVINVMEGFVNHEEAQQEVAKTYEESLEIVQKHVEHTQMLIDKYEKEKK